MSPQKFTPTQQREAAINMGLTIFVTVFALTIAWIIAWNIK